MARTPEPLHVTQGRKAVQYFSDLGYSEWNVTLMTAWCVAELAWKFQEHGHNGGGDWGTEWGPRLPHWK